MGTARTPFHFSIDDLILLVQNGGKVRTGIDIFSKKGTLLLEKNALVEEVSILSKAKKQGITDIPILHGNAGGVWDSDGSELGTASAPERLPLPDKNNFALPPPGSSAAPPAHSSQIMKKVQEIQELKREAAGKYRAAKKNIKKIILQVIETGGEFDVEKVEETVTDLFDFITRNSSAFSYLTKEIFSYDDYLYNHSINVCTIGTAILRNFNDHFSSTVSQQLNTMYMDPFDVDHQGNDNSFTYYFPEELHDIATGFFMHDLGKVLIDKAVLLKTSRLTDAEFETVKQHSTEKGIELLEKNKLRSSFLANISKYHHASLYPGEPRCYPDDRAPGQIPPYVKICKLADIYDAMTSKRCYKEAHNPVAVVADIFHKYAGKDQLLQIILHSFVKAIGIHPPGSIVWLTNGQLVYIIDSNGPTVLPITDTGGVPLSVKADPLVLGKAGEGGSALVIDRRKTPLSPTEAYKLLPGYLKETLYPASSN